MKISVVIPTLNAGSRFDALLSSIASQDLAEPPEVVVVDSESEDGTPELAERHGASVHRIPRADFNHGSTRNLGIKIANGEFIALLSQDAVPRDDQWLPALLEPFSDHQVAGVYSKIIAQPNATPLVTRSVKADLVAGDVLLHKKIQDIESWSRLPAPERRLDGHFNNIASCVRRSAIAEFDFPALSFGEDLAWGLRVLRSGGALVFQPRSVVEHSHPSSLSMDFRRHRLDARLLRILFDFRPSLIVLGRALIGEVLLDIRALRSCSWSERIIYALYSPCLRSAQTLGRFVGAHVSDMAPDRAALNAWQAAGRASKPSSPEEPQRIEYDSR